MREDAQEDKSDPGARNPLMQTYADDAGLENAAAAADTTDGDGEAGSGLPQVA